MPSLHIDTLREIVNLSENNFENYKSFVETGTHYGDTVLPMSNFFDNLYTIELGLNYYDYFNNLEFDRNKIKNYLGDSSKVLPEILPGINTNAIFFLDGHYSSDNTAKGDKDVPLIEEILSINNFFRYSGIIIIDDLRLFGTKLSEDWSEITKESVTEPIKKRLTKTIEYGDRFVIIFN